MTGAPPAPGERVSVALVTGFLGSGKTTLVNRLLADRDGPETAVIVNEFGTVPIDHLLLASVAGDIGVLASGCVCCTVRDELVTTMTELLALRERGEIPRFRRLVIEASGLAEPGPVIRKLMSEPIVAAHYAPASVVTTVDAIHAPRTLDGHEVAVAQVALADLLVITKLDIAQEAATRPAIDAARALNPLAPIARGAEQALDHGLGHAAADPARMRGRLDSADHLHGAHAGIETFCLTREGAVGFAQLAAALARLREAFGTDLLRVKGLVAITGRPGPAVVHGVQGMIHVPDVLRSWPDADRRTKLVFIARRISPATVSATLADALGPLTAYSSS